MDRELAKLITLPILAKWDRMTVWLVKWPAGNDTTECRWFRSEQKAREFMALPANATIQAIEFNSNEHPTLSDDLLHDAAVPYDPNHG